MPTVLCGSLALAGEKALSWFSRLGGTGWLTYLGVAASIVAPAIVWPRSRVSPSARSFAWWLVLGGATNLVGLTFAHLGMNNHGVFLGYRLLSVLLLGLTGYQLLSAPTQRRLVVGGTVVYLLFWLALTVSGVESLTYFSRFTSPGEKAAGILLGVLLVAQSIRASAESPLRRPEAWIGIGLVLASATALTVFPIMGELAHRSGDQAMQLKRISSLFGDVALVLWCIPYWKRSVTWTR